MIVDAQTAGRSRRRRVGSIPIGLPRPRLLLALAALIALLAGGWLWLRDSSLVAVRKVTVIGIDGPDAARITRALVLAGRKMTTLDVRVDQLNSAVASYPVVKSLRVSSQFPHGLRIEVIEQQPVGVVSVGGRSEPVSSDGTLLHDAGRVPQLPTIQLGSSPRGTRITSAAGRRLVALLAAAPQRLLPHVSAASEDPTHGLVAQLRAGPAIYFGSTDRLVAKWRAALAVLSASSSAGAAYIDVSDPERPVAGVGAAATGSSTTSTGSSTTSTGSSTTSSTGATATSSTPTTSVGTATSTTPTTPATSAGTATSTTPATSAGTATSTTPAPGSSAPTAGTPSTGTSSASGGG